MRTSIFKNCKKLKVFKYFLERIEKTLNTIFIKCQVKVNNNQDNRGKDTGRENYKFIYMLMDS